MVILIWIHLEYVYNYAKTMGAIIWSHAHLFWAGNLLFFGQSGTPNKKNQKKQNKSNEAHIEQPLKIITRKVQT